MLSPSMITKSNGNSPRYDAISSASAYCASSPVPLSPMTANRTDLGFSGSVRSFVPAGSKLARNRKSTKRRIALTHDIRNKIDNQVCLYVPEHQGVANHPVLHLRRQ